MARQRKLVAMIAPLLVVLAVFVVVASAARNPVAKRPSEGFPQISPENMTTVTAVDQVMVDRWQGAGVEPAKCADDLTLFRRLSLVLHGTIPSLEEIRLFESEDSAERLPRWTERMLADRRFADYFARRFSRVFVGADQGQFVVFRRDRFWTWLGDQFHANRPYDAIVRDMISQRGLWTDKPEVNFIAAAVSDGAIDPNKLAGRTVRAFLGQRMDCAQCHNHPFADWKQQQFKGLAACFSRVSFSPVGIEDNQRNRAKPQQMMMPDEPPGSPDVPFHTEWMPDEGTLRERLAAWVTDPRNRRFDRAVVNRVWGLMFGKSWVQPVDDIPNPSEAGIDAADLLDVLGEDFRVNGRDLKRLIRTIAATQVFRQSSEHPAMEHGDRANDVDQAWAVFPMTRLRPEQVIGSMLQASSIKTNDRDSHWTRRAIQFFNELDFVKEYGDLGEDELTERAGTIPQALLRMNSKYAAEWTKATPFSSVGRIAAMAPDDDARLDLCFLICLTRRPVVEERLALRTSLQGTSREERSRVVEDLFWSLFNSPEFCWEH